MATTKIVLSGPIFDGTAAEAAAQFTASLAKEIAEVGGDWIKLDTDRMTRSGSDTGAAAGGVEVAGSGSTYTISGGISEGRYSWPWLEGTSRRNQSTPFKGYHTFRRTRLRMRTQMQPLIDGKLAEFMPRMGGESS